MTDDELAKLQKIARRKLVKTHQPIFRDGEAADQYFNIVKGVVKLVKTLEDGKQHIVGLMYPPDFLAQPLEDRHTYSAEAATDVELCCFPRAPFDALLSSQPRLERKILEFTLRELDICRDWTLLLGRKSSYERVASFLYMVARRATLIGCSGEDRHSVRFELPFTRSEIADYLGLTLETVSRQFTQLKAKKIIFLPTHREIVVPEMELLAAVGHIDHCLEANS